MTFNNSTLAGLLQNINHEKTKFITMLYKIKRLLEISEKDGYMVIRTHTNKLTLTEDITEIYENVKFSHPVIKIFYEFLLKSSKCVNGGEYFIKTVRRIVDECMEMLDSGVSAKDISNKLRKIKISMEETHEAFGTKTLVNSILKNVHLTNLLCDAVEEVGDFDPEKIRVIKVNTGVFMDSYRVNGMVVPNQPKGKIKKLSKTTVGIFDCPLDLKRPELKGTVLLKNAEELANYSKDETERIKKVVDGICVNAILVNGTINAQFLDFCNLRNILVLPLFNRYDVVRMAHALKAPVYTDLEATERNYAKVEEIECFRAGNKNFTKIVGNGKIQTVVLKHSLPEVLEEYEKKFLFLLNALKEKEIKVNRKKVKIESTNHVEAVVSRCIVEEMFMIDSDRERCFRYSLEFVATVLEVNDYLMAQKEEIALKAPPKYMHEDH
ncbi:CCT8 [Ecytonucleospora hepatopenaei]|uniref:CCT8 n=1 Tax=Ecytonucleospora hepatopenaei TaxID=646526 RepID=A0A1W0E5Y5_9MICR|nr:CCT8 [Ecytonucleospora hepatopenaei]